MSLENFMKMPEKKKSWLLIDGYNMFYRNLFVAEKEDPMDPNFRYWKSLCIQSITGAISQFNPSRTLFILDARLTWRKKFYPDYKAHRKIARAKSTVDFDLWYPILEEFSEELKSILTKVYFLKVHGCEGDDIIGTMVKKVIPQTDSVCIFSTDQDFLQLQKSKNVKQYDPIRRDWLVSINPEKDLALKIIQGDRGDNITAIKPKTGPKKAIPLYENLEETLKDEAVKKLYVRNKILIDLKYVPVKLQNRIIDEFTQYKIHPFNAQKFMMLVSKYKVVPVLDKMAYITNKISALV